MGEFGHGNEQDKGRAQSDKKDRASQGDKASQGDRASQGKRSRRLRRGLSKQEIVANERSHSLSIDQVYRCPACGSGELSAIALMDVFACDFCHHMFTANLQTQSLQLADSQLPMAWRWNGERWRTAHQGNTAAPVIWTFCGGLMVTPVLLIALSNYIFPPLNGSNFPVMWTGLTFVSHGVIATWLLSEYHRWPWYVSGRIRLQRMRERMLNAD